MKSKCLRYLHSSLPSLILKCSEPPAKDLPYSREMYKKNHTLWSVSYRFVRSVKRICLPLIRIQTKGGCRQKSVMIHARCGWTLPCLQKDRLGLNSVFETSVETSVEKWAAKKYCFCTGAKRKAQSRLNRKWLVYLPLPHNRIQRERHTVSESLSFSARYSPFPFMMGWKCCPGECVHLYVCRAPLSVFERLHIWHTSLLSISSWASLHM